MIAIVGVLAALVTVNLQDAREKARDAQRKSDLRNIRNALELYKNDQKPPTYPETLDILLIGGYMNSTPEDPLYKQSDISWVDYAYTLVSPDLNNRSLEYTLVACLENASDVDKDGTNLCANGVSYTLIQP